MTIPVAVAGNVTRAISRRARQEASKLEAALHYANLGWQVFPLHYMTDEGVCSCGGAAVNGKCKPGKHPYGVLVPNGHKNATTAEDVIHRWFDGNPYNIGIATGLLSEFWVLDVDGREGTAVLVELEAKPENGRLPDTLRVLTGGGGQHYYFRMPSGIGIANSEKLVGPYIDVRGTGGYVVAPRSNHESGTDYEWDNCDLPSLDLIAEAPQWLIDRATTKKSSRNAGAKGMFDHQLPFEWRDKIHDGEGRESFLLGAAGHLRGKGVDQKVIELVLLAVNKSNLRPPLSDEVVLDRARRYVKASPALRADEWPEPVEVKPSLPPVDPFDYRLLPPVFRAWVKDIAERMQCPPDFLAVGALVTVGALVGNRIAVQPKRRDFGWIEVPNLWGAVVGRPGVMKSPALAEVVAPLKDLEFAAVSNQAGAAAQYAIDKMVYEAAKKKVEEAIRKGATVAPHQMPTEPVPPQPKRFLVNDATYEKLGAILQGNPHGLLVFQDELAGVLMRLDAEGQESSRAFYLQAWGGTQPYTFDRIGRGTVGTPHLCFSLLGSIQPGRIREYLRAAVYGGKGDDGLAQRLQMLVYPDIPAEWTSVDRPPDLAALQAARAVFLRIAALDPASVGAHIPTGHSIPTLSFTDDAQALFDQWRSLLETDLRQGDHHPALESHFAKYRGFIPTLALLDHLILGASGPIGLPSMKRAVRWHVHLEKHAQRVYASVTSAAADSAKALCQRIRRGALKDGFTVRDVYRHGWSMLTTRPEATDAVEMLVVDLGWLRAVADKAIDGEGRPTVRYLINPKINAAQ